MESGDAGNANIYPPGYPVIAPIHSAKDIPEPNGAFSDYRPPQ
jgi:hypothetical protein